MTCSTGSSITVTAPYHPGYERACQPGSSAPGGCVFGEEWTDDNTTRFGHNGCDTRQDVLLQQMHHIELRWGSECRIYQARMRDPYTGRRLTWRRDGYRIQIDHLYPLSRAWYAGAWAWTQNATGPLRQRRRPRARRHLGRRQPGQGSPRRRRSGCRRERPTTARYVVTYLRVAVRYGLSVTEADVATMEDVAAAC